MLNRQGELLKPYLPRLLIEWERDAPESAYQAREGSLAFVDISGFTALTERLSRRGKIGAELLRDTLDGVFKSLLDEAYSWGAGLLKWGGDALLLFFDGPGHPERAVRAAWELQRTIDRVGRIRVPGGTVALRMSVGVTTGKVEFFTAGSVHRELLIAGPAATETVLAEAVADPGEVALSPALGRLLAPSCVGPTKGDALLLATPPAAERWQVHDVGSIDDLDIARCIPLAAREHVLLERSEPEHRMITATFFDLMNTDALLAEIGPAAFAKALDDRIRVIQETAARYEVPFNVTDISKGAIKVLLSAGAPSTTGHDEEQTLRLVRDVFDEPGVIPMRVGIDSGRVFTGDFGPPYRRTYALLGDAINTAARLMARAEAGQILATEQVLERSRTVFRTSPIAPFRAKGKAEPVHASQVGEVTGRRDERISVTPFVGRDRELASLRAVLDDVQAGTGWTVEIAGPSGIGKTRLVREVLAAAPDVRVLHSTCEEYEASTPYYALRDPVRDILGLSSSAAPEASERRLREAVEAADDGLVPWIPLLGILLGLDLPATSETGGIDKRFLRDVLADVTLRFLVSVLGASPIAFVVDDAQFMDESSAQLLRRLSKARSMPYLLVVTRTDPGRLWTDVSDEEQRYVVFNLLPLSEREAASIVEAVTDDEPLRPHDVEELARRSGGSPLFLVELMNVTRSTGSTESLPDSVEAVISADIDRLPASDRIVLRYASVLGVTFEEELLRATVQDEIELDEALWERMKGLLDRDSDGLLRFRNTLIRDTAYEGLSFRRRRELHGYVAEALETSAASVEDEAATLALHYAAAGRHEATWRYARLGGDRARALTGNLEAVKLYELALGAARHMRNVAGHERADVLIALGTVRDLAGLFAESFDAFRRASILLRDDPVECAQAFALRTRARVRTGPWSLGLREAARGLRLVAERDEIGAVAARATLRAMQSEIRMYQGHAREAIALALTAVDEAEHSGELRALARASGALLGAYYTLGDFDHAHYGRAAIDIYAGLGDVRTQGISEMNLGVQEYAAGAWGEAEDLYRRAREHCLHAGDRQYAAIAAANLGELLASQGRLDEAERVLADARRSLRSSGYVPFALFTEIHLARCRLARGDADGAVEALRRIVAESTGAGHATIQLDAAVYLALAHARAGSPAAGLEALDAAMASADSEAILYAASAGRARGECLAALGQTTAARECLEAALGAARSRNLPYEQLLIRRALHRLGVSGGLAEESRLARLLGLAS